MIPTTTLFYKNQILYDTCDIITGSVVNPSTVSDVACLPIPPKEEQVDVTFQILVDDTSQAYTPGCRVVHNSLQYVISRVEREFLPEMAVLISTEWPETLS